MDRRFLLKTLGFAAAAAAVLHPVAGDAMPVAPRPSDASPKIGESAVATDADLEAVQPEKTYWVRRRRRRFYRRRYFFRPRYRFYRRRRFFRRRFYF